MWLVHLDEDAGEASRVVLHVAAVLRQVQQVKFVCVVGCITTRRHEVVQLRLHQTQGVWQSLRWLWFMSLWGHSQIARNLFYLRGLSRRLA
jgi:hypothetical protein